MADDEENENGVDSSIDAGIRETASRSGSWDEYRLMVIANLRQINHKIDGLGKTFVTKEEFKPIAKLVYGCVSIMLGTVVLAILALAIKAGGAMK